MREEEKGGAEEKEDDCLRRSEKEKGQIDNFITTFSGEEEGIKRGR